MLSIMLLELLLQYFGLFKSFRKLFVQPDDIKWQLSSLEVTNVFHRVEGHILVKKNAVISHIQAKVMPSIINIWSVAMFLEFLEPNFWLSEFRSRKLEVI